MHALETQVGGDHYKNMAYQPAQFIYEMKLRFGPGAIVKYISRHKVDRLEDLRKAIHYCEICAEENDVSFRMILRKLFPLRLNRKVWKYVRANNFDLPGITTNAIMAVSVGDWEKAKFNIEILIDYHLVKTNRPERYGK